MKKSIFTSVFALLLLAVPVIFSSCSKDIETAMELNGLWQGNFDVPGAMYTEVEFHWSAGHHGWGNQYDYYNKYDYNTRGFDWRVENGNISIKYKNGEVRTIYDYYMNEAKGLFTGYFDANKSRQFTLTKVIDPN